MRKSAKSRDVRVFNLKLKNLITRILGSERHQKSQSTFVLQAGMIKFLVLKQNVQRKVGIGMCMPLHVNVKVVCR